MSIRVFTNKEIKVLSENPYVKSVSSKGITYTDEFKQIFITENEKGKHPSYLCELAGGSRSGYYNYFSAKAQEESGFEISAMKSKVI